MMRRYFVYILANRRYGVLYVGLTNDLHRRMFQHRSKAVPGFTREHGIIRLVYFEEYASITEARARERSLKRWRRAWKLALVDKSNPEWRDLTEEHFVIA
ncbi:MAG: GIY-YIG nuclease family protein [Xanthobacteraceae bacterium]